MIEKPSLGVVHAPAPDATSPQAASAPPSLEARHLEFATFHEGYLGRYITLADTKATLTFGVTAAVLGWLLSQKPFITVLLRPELAWPFATAAAATTLLIAAAGDEAR
jgi:hypothetical protein